MRVQLKLKSFKKTVDLVDYANYKVAGEEKEAINTPAILVLAEGDKTFLVALNREMYMKMPIPGTVVYEEGSVALDSSSLKKMLKAISDENIELNFTEGDDKVKIISGEDTNEMTTLNLVKFKKLPAFEEKRKLCDVVAGVLSNSIKSVASAIPSKAQQIALNSCCVEFGMNCISFVGFDGYKLIKYDLQMEDGYNLDFYEKILIPTEAADALVRTLAKGTSLVSMSFCDNNGKKYLVIEKENIVVAIRLRDYKYPDYDSLLRSDYDFTFVVDQSSLKDTIASIAGIGSAKEALPVHFIFDGSKVTLRFVTQDSTIAKTLAIESMEGEPERFRMLAKSLKEVLPYLEARIRIKVFKNGLVIITPESSNSYILVTRTLD